MPRLLSLLASLVIAAATCATPGQAAQGTIAIARGTTVDLRRGPAEAFEPLSQLRNGAEVEVLSGDPANMWLKVRDAGGNIGWIPQSALANPRAATIDQAARGRRDRGTDQPDWIRRDASNRSSTELSAYSSPPKPTHSQVERDGRETLYVNSPSAGALNLRAGPGTNTDILDSLRHGSAVTILGGGDPWRRVRSETGQIGYVHGNYLTSDTPNFTTPPRAAPEPQTPGRVLETLFVNAPQYGALNLREGPGTDFAIAQTMPQGTRLEVLDGGTETWRFVRAENGQLGFAHSGYLSAMRPSAALPRAAERRSRDEQGRRVIRVTPQELPGLLAACVFAGDDLNRCMARTADRRNRN